MASTATARLRLEKQGTGDNLNSWGTKLNTTGLDLIDAAIAGMASYTLSGSKTLTSNNYAADEARMPFQNITGGSGGTVTVPSAEGKWFFYNQSSGSVIVTTGTGTTATLAASDAVWVFCDGTNCYTGLTKAYVDAAIASAALGGLTNLPPSQGGTGITSYAVGDLLYASASTTLAKLAGVATGNVLLSGGVTTAPAWGKVGLTTHVTGTLPVANGGTGTASTTGSGSVVYGTSPTLSSPSLTGTPTAPTATAGTNTTQIATTAFVKAADDLKANLASPALTGTPTAPTAAAATSTTQIATTAFVMTAVGTGWTLLATATPSGTAAVDFTSISSSYADLLVVFESVSHTGTSIPVQFGVAPSGTATASLAVSAQFDAADVFSGAIFIPGARLNAGVNLSGINTSVVASSGYPVGRWTSSGGIGSIRLGLASGTYDAGTIKLYGKK